MSATAALRLRSGPELDEPGGVEARDELTRRLLGRRVKLRIYAHDRYGRAVAEVRKE